MHRTPTTRRAGELTKRSQSPDSGSFEGGRPSSQPHAWERFLRAYIAHGHDASERTPPASSATRRPRRWPQLRARGRIGSVEPRGRTPPNDDVVVLAPFNFNNIRDSIQNIGSQGHQEDAALRTQLVMKFTASTKPVQRGLPGTLRACSRGYENLGITETQQGSRVVRIHEIFLRLSTSRWRRWDHQSTTTTRRLWRSRSADVLAHPRDAQTHITTHR